MLPALAATVDNLYRTRRHPLSLVHFVTERCNARCPFCFVDFDHPGPQGDELTVAEIERLARTLGPRLRNVNLTGGEPFLRPDLAEIADVYLRNAGIESLYLTTNGSFPDRVEAFARRVRREHPGRRLILSFSVDAAGERHDAIRRLEGSFERSLESYHRVRRVEGTDANVAITVSRENHAEAEALYESLVEEHGVRSVSCIAAREAGVFSLAPGDRAPILEAYRAVTGRILRDLATGRLAGYDPTTWLGRLMNAKNRILYERVAESYLEPRYVSPCQAGALFGVLRANGDVTPCEVLDHVYGNVRDAGLDFEAVWRSGEACASRRWIRETRCTCTYECALAFTILADVRNAPRFAAASLPRPAGGA